MDYRVAKPFNSHQRRFLAGDTIKPEDVAELAPHTVEGAKAAGLIVPAAAPDQAANLPLDQTKTGTKAAAAAPAGAE